MERWGGESLRFQTLIQTVIVLGQIFKLLNKTRSSYPIRKTWKTRRCWRRKTKWSICCRHSQMLMQWWDWSIKFSQLHNLRLVQVIHDVLSRHEFKVDEAASELSRCHAVQLKSKGYAKWKEENGLKEANNQGKNNMKRKQPSEDTSYNRKRKCESALMWCHQIEL